MIIPDQAERLREMVQAAQTSANTANQKKCKVFCVTSGKGGVGKTSFTVNFAIALAKCGKKVAILDADFGFSNVNIMLGTNSKFNMSHVLNGEKKLDEIMEECFPDVWHISGGAGMSDLVQVDELKLAAAMKQMNALEAVFDYIIIDTGAGINNNVLRMIDASDTTILVMTSEPTSIVDSYVVLKTASQLDKMPEILALVNKAEAAKDAMSTYGSFAKVVSKHLRYDVKMMGYLPQDNRMTESISSLVPHIMKYPSSLLSAKIQSIANDIAQTEVKREESKGIKGFFGRFFSKEVSQTGL